MTEAKKTILIVDDEPEAIEFVKTAISEMGDYAVISAPDGERGFEKAKAEIPDLIILDVMMPGKQGFYVFHDIRQEPTTKHIPVIMLTGIGDATGVRFSKEDMGEYLGKEPEDYIEKPVDPKTLQAAIRKVFES